MNYFSCVIETVLISIILLTIFLNAVVQLLVNGRVDRVFTTLGIAAAGGLTDNPNSESAQFSWSNLPFEEEWGVVLMRIGTASLEATGLKGWGNEVAPISAPVPMRAPLPQLVRRRGRNPPPPPPPEPLITYGSVRMGRSGVGSVFSGHRVSESRPAGGSGANRSGRQVQLRGWNNEVRSVETNSSGSSTRRGVERRRWVWLRELVRFTKSAFGVIWGLMRFSWSWACRWKDRKGFGGAEDEDRVRRRGHVVDVADGVRLTSGAAELERQKREREVYERFLRGEEISDDEDDAVVDEYEDGSASSSEVEDDDGLEGGPSTIFERATSVMREDEDQGREDEAIALFADLVRTQGVDEGSKLVLSHLVHGSVRATGRESALPAPPLTRRRWGEMGRRWGLEITDELEGEEDVWDLGLEPRRNNSSVDGEGEAGGEADWTDRAMCIICTSRPRDIVSWPCR